MAVDITRIVGFRLELAFIPVGTGILAAEVAGRQGFETRYRGPEAAEETPVILGL